MIHYGGFRMQAKRYENAPVSGSGEALLTNKEARRLVNIGTTNFYYLIRNGEICNINIGKSRRVEPAAIAEFIERLRAGNSYIAYEADKADYPQPLHILPDI